MSYIVYLHTNTLNGKAYVGLTKQTLRARWNRHCSEARSGSDRAFHHAIRKHGAASFTSEILYIVEAEDEAKRLEVAETGQRKTYGRGGYNATRGGDGGLDPTPEVRAKMRAAALKPERMAILLSEERRAALAAKWDDPTYQAMMAQKGASMLSIMTKTPEWRAKASARQKGREFSADHRARIAATMTGRTLSAETIAKRSATVRGTKRSAASVEKTRLHHVKRYVVTYPDGREAEIVGLNAFCKENGLTPSAACLVAQGKQPAHKGFKFRAAEAALVSCC